ncbi:MAG: Cof-type HAD-IIB family hydrolase [Chitinispirillales bacterium]|jgi:Cof subfamily protein (haloacid dehalogenase superfamily)|nr:Cof-type HAD-IIB family hydrolase [Chitinispirillales bacterium]
MIPKLFAFDLDGTLLDSRKRISLANVNALREMRDCGAKVVLASGRLISSMERYLPVLGLDPAMLTLNGAEVFTSSKDGGRRIYSAQLDPLHSCFLINYCADKPVTLNYYFEGKLYTVKSANNAKWIDLYYQQTKTDYIFLDKFDAMTGISPSKIVLVGDSVYLDSQEKYFRSLWDEESVYICRSWGHYLEFLSPKANKGLGLQALCENLGVNISEAAAFGDAQNDIPMLKLAGLGIAMKNSTDETKKSALRVTEMTNDEDGIALEWEKIKANYSL